MSREQTPYVLFVDNFDSFTFNLVDEFGRRGCELEVWRNDAPADELLARLQARRGRPRLLVLSPGPGAPAQAGCCVELVQSALGQVPMVGVCLGHQVLVEALGGTLGRAPEILHGKATAITHTGRGLFAGLPSPLRVGRYHSLCATELPPSLRPIAHAGQVVMAVEHATHPALGVQFHPESILTRHGGALIERMIALAIEEADQTC